MTVVGRRGRTDGKVAYARSRHAEAKIAADPTDDEVRARLECYRCPVPFHAVRTRFLGNIATPATQSAPMDTVAALWGGHMPVFESLDATNELIGALVMGLWNRLTRHQERSAPFRLTRIEVPVTREGMSQLALMRREELEGFVGTRARRQMLEVMPAGKPVLH